MNLKHILRHADPRLVGLIVLSLLLAAGLYFGFYARYQAQLDSAGGEVSAAERELVALSDKITALEGNGVADADQLSAQVSAIEQAMPPQVDDLLVATTVGTAANNSGVTLDKLDKGDPEQTPAAVGPLTPVAYSFAVTGQYTNVMAFTQAVLQSDRYVATYGDVSLRAGSPAADAEPVIGDDSLTDGPVALSGTLLFWALAATSAEGEPGETPGTDGTEDGGLLEPADSGEPLAPQTTQP